MFKLPTVIKNKQEARNLAIDWQNWQSEQSLSYGEVTNFQTYFKNLGKRFGLIREFKENAIV
jgi:hypothetical protein